MSSSKKSRKKLNTKHFWLSRWLKTKRRKRSLSRKKLKKRRDLPTSFKNTELGLLVRAVDHQSEMLREKL